MPDADPTPEAPVPEPDSEPVLAVARATRGRKPEGALGAKPRARPPRKRKGPTAAELAALDELRKELAFARAELDATRQEVTEVVGTCREAEARVAATRAGADVIRRAVVEIDTSAAAARGAAEGARAEADRTHERAEQTERRLARLREWLTDARAEFAALDAEARRTIDNFRAAIEETQRAARGEISTETSAELPDVAALPPENQAADVRTRLVHLLDDAWGVEKELVGLLQTLADETSDAEVRTLLEEHRAAAQARQESVATRLSALDVKPASGRGLLGQLATRLWDAVRAPRDQADQAVLAVLKALAATEFLAGIYAAVHATARAAGGPETADFAAEHFREVRGRADQFRAALGPTVTRAALRGHA